MKKICFLLRGYILYLDEVYIITTRHSSKLKITNFEVIHNIFLSLLKLFAIKIKEPDPWNKERRKNGSGSKSLLKRKRSFRNSKQISENFPIFFCPVPSINCVRCRKGEIQNDKRTFLAGRKLLDFTRWKMSAGIIAASRANWLK